MSEALESTKRILTESPNGWVMEYYPEKNHSIGGFVYLCSFSEDMQVTIASEVLTKNFTPGEKAVSTYNLISDRGPVLTFDTYNEILHHFAEPTSTSPDGQSGDYEFVIEKATPDMIIMKGKKHNNRIVMLPLPAGKDWKSYIDDIIHISNKTAYGLYKIFIDNVESGKAEQTDRTLSIINPDSTFSQSFIYTPTGIKYYEPVQIGRKFYQEFTWNDADKVYVSADGMVKLAVNIPPDFVLYSEYLGDWILEVGATNKQQFPITLHEQKKNSSFIVTGLDFDFTLNYDLRNGRVSFTSHPVGRHSGNYVYLCAWDADNGYLTWTAGIGAFSMKQNSPSFKISFTDNGVWSDYYVSGFLFWTFNSAGTSVGKYTGGQYQFAYPVMTKK